MRFLLTDHYAHANGVRLSPGEYDGTDPRVQGLGWYLVNTGQATLLESDSQDTTDVLAAAEVDYEAYTVAELKAAAAAREIDLAGANKKADIIALLIAADEANAAENGEYEPPAADAPTAEDAAS